MFLIPSVSMENTLRVEDRVVVEKLTDRTWRGDRLLRSRRLAHRHDDQQGSIGKAFEFVGVLPDTGTEHSSSA